MITGSRSDDNTAKLVIIVTVHTDNDNNCNDNDNKNNGSNYNKNQVMTMITIIPYAPCMEYLPTFAYQGMWIYNDIYNYIPGWWYTYPSEKYISQMG